MQIIIFFGVLAVFIAVVIYKYIRDLSKREDIRTEDVLTHDDVCSKVSRQLAEMLKKDNIVSKDDIEYKAARDRKIRIEDAYTNCVFGIEQDRIIIKDLIVSILKDIFPDKESILKVYPYDSTALPALYKQEILFEFLYPEHRKNTLKYLIHKYKWDVEHYDIENGSVPSYAITNADLDEAFNAEVIRPLTYREALSVTATLCYMQLKGFGCVDTLRTMNIDGFNIGTSGSIMPNTDEVASNWRAYQSVWIYFEGKYIHARYLSFFDMDEVRRVVTLLCRYGNPGPLTEKRGYIVNTMEDQSRVLALRPPASEYWACFVRKFVLSSKSLESLINPKILDPFTGEAQLDVDGNVKYKYNNGLLPLKTVSLLMKGQVTTAFTGRQGSGKTTMMTGAIAEVDGRFTIRVLEMAPEMYLRELYPQRNILSVRETTYITAAELQDALKKSDAALSIVGEVATDVIAARMLQMGQVASIFTIFSHHANRTKDLVHAITNSIVAASGGTATPATVEPQVIDVIHVDVHLDYDVEGNRYIERITEIVRLDSQPYPERKKGESPVEYDIRLRKEYYTRQTDREMFTTHDIVVFDYSTFTYKTADWFTPELTKHIFSRIPAEDKHMWADWVKETWG